MKVGPNRKIVTDGGIWLEQGTRQPLGRIGKVNFSELPQAENDILDDFDWHDSLLRSEQHAPDQSALEAKSKKLTQAVEAAFGAIRSFLEVDGGWHDRHEFRAAVNDLLRDAEVSPTYFWDLVEEGPHYLDRLATATRAIQVALADRLGKRGPDTVSSPTIRKQFLCRLHRTLSRHGLDAGLGVNSLIVELVLIKQGKVSDFADPVERRRKDLAREIKLAVNPRKGG